jgi:hypothetical protein
MNAVPNSLAKSSASFSGMSRRQLSMVMAYELQQIAKNTMTPNQLARAAACFDCYPSFDLEITKTFLLWQISLGVTNPVTDPDVAAFISCTGITDPTQIGAVTTLVASLKSANLWNSFDAIYPFVGGTATSNSCNLKNPAKFSIIWHGSGIIHNANGVTGDGTSAYGDTGFNAATAGGNYSLNSGAYGLYSKTQNPAACAFMGASSGLFNASYFGFAAPNISVTGLNTVNFNNSNTETNASGNIILSRTDAATQALYSFSGTQANNAASSALITNTVAVLGANFSGGPGSFAAMNFAFAFISAGFSAGQVATLQPIITTYETTLGRA